MDKSLKNKINLKRDIKNLNNLVCSSLESLNKDININKSSEEHKETGKEKEILDIIKIDYIKDELNENNDLENFRVLKKINSDFEKLHGRLYRTYDVRSLKNRLWNTLQKFKHSEISKNKFPENISKNKNLLLNAKQEKENEEEKNNQIDLEQDINLFCTNKGLINNENEIKQEDDITFKMVYENTLKSMNPEMKNNLNDSMLFVCMLHLANEKSKYFYLFFIFRLLFVFVLFNITKNFRFRLNSNRKRI